MSQTAKDKGLRVSARELVACVYFPPDITPTRGSEAMLAGAEAHRARQKRAPEGFEIERPVKGEIELAGETITVFGRMDASRAALGDQPALVEEIKLAATAPSQPLPEHLAQAIVYAALLGDERVDMHVVYVDAQGELLQDFAQTLERSALADKLREWLARWLTVALREREHARVRDEALRAARFPFASYRAGQREMAAQVYTAITRRKRLFASMPTGTGKSVAVLFPALKAMGEGRTGKVLYLTSRNTARQSPLNALELICSQGVPLRVSLLTAKEKMCPTLARCHPDDCPRARGHYLRQDDGIADMLAIAEPWTEARIGEVADRHDLCPFEFALALAGLADVALMDVNYAFDPFVQLAFLFDRRRDVTLLIDEAHHLLERVRESLSGEADGRMLREARASFGKAVGRKHPYYAALSAMVRALDAIELPEQNRQGLREAVLPDMPTGLAEANEVLLEQAFELIWLPMPGEQRTRLMDVIRSAARFAYAASHRAESEYALLAEAHGKARFVKLLSLSPGDAIAAVTKSVRGTVFFSATLAPLRDMRALLGGAEDDACFAMPSPFPPERLAVVRKRVQTRYAYREQSAELVASCILEALNARRGKYIAYFPSYAYMRLVLERLTDPPVPLLVQEGEMSEEARDRFLRAFTEDAEPKLGLCVLGGLFAEGVDLPGDQLIGVMIVGMGLPTPTLELRTMQGFYARRFGDGFHYACRIPAMQKVSQAGGRVVRTETDRGMIVLLDDRYYDPEYAALLPSEWRLTNEDVAGAARKLEEL